MSSMTYGQKMFKPSAPDKGSFPLDHEGECRNVMLGYMSCIMSADGENAACREQARLYLSCRMQRGLMAQEDFTKLGFHNQTETTSTTSP